MSKLYQYYQPNEKDAQDRYGDCTIRALSKAFDCTWLEAFRKEIPFCEQYQTSNIFDVPVKTRNEIFDQLGFDYTGISNGAGADRPTVKEFAKSHRHGTYIANVAKHVVCIKDGKYYDTWDSGDKSLYGYFTKREDGASEPAKRAKRGFKGLTDYVPKRLLPYLMHIGQHTKEDYGKTCYYFEFADEVITPSDAQRSHFVIGNTIAECVRQMKQCKIKEDE